MVPRQIHRLIHDAGEGRLADVLGDVDQHGAGTAGGRDVVGFTTDARQVVGVLHQVVMLHDRSRDVEDVGFLEGILAQHPGHLLPAQNDHRHAVHHGRHDPGYSIAGTRAGGDEHSGRLACGTRIAISHVNGSLFMTDEDELHVRLHGFQSVKEGQGGSAGVPEDILDAECIEGFDKRLSAVHFFGWHEFGW